VALIGFADAKKDHDAPQNPFIVVRSIGGMQRDPNRGLRMAIWKDGTVLFSPIPEKLGYAMLIGHLDEKNISELLELFKQSGLFNQRREGYVVPDSGYTSIRVEGLGGRTWHENLMPGFGGNIDDGGEYHRFVKSWKKCTGAMEALVPIHLKRLDENVTEPKAIFRGYNSSKPVETPWLR
jgi:hypothetical protein